MAKLKITLKKSKIGRIEKHVKNVEALGLKKVGQTRSRSEERRVGKECRSRWSPYH